MPPTTLPLEQGAGITVLEGVLWRALDTVAADQAFARSWLALLCRQLPRTVRGVLALRQPDGVLSPAAHWPEADPGSPALVQAAELAADQGRGVAAGGAGADGRTDAFAFPLTMDGALAAVVAVECAAGPEASQREVLRQLQWGLASVEAVLRRESGAAIRTRAIATEAAMAVMATVIGAQTFDDAARALATELATRLAADRVSVGWLRGRRMRVVALSHGLGFVTRMALIRGLASAMEEAADREQTILHPAEPGSLPAPAHGRAATLAGSGAMLTVPVLAGDTITGALTIEWQGRPDQQAVSIAEAVAALAGGMLQTQRRAERWIAVQAAEVGWRWAVRLLGAGHPGLKLGVLAAAAVVTFFALFTTEYRISARAVIEGETRRTIAAGMDGYVASESVRAGAIVHAGDLLATLDRSELVLTRLRWLASREQRRLDLDKALAAGQRAEVAIAQAQVNEAAAQVALLDEQIGRTEIIAPFDGIVLSGDLSQSVGASVQRAQVLFEVAPLDAYRLIARVADVDIAAVQAGQRGTAVLAALPDDRWDFTVTKVTPIAETADGANVFKVEARLDAVDRRLRPNMEGAARIETGERRLIWIWTHHLIGAARLWLWSWWP